MPGKGGEVVGVREVRAVPAPQRSRHGSPRRRWRPANEPLPVMCGAGRTARMPKTAGTDQHRDVERLVSVRRVAMSATSAGPSARMPRRRPRPSRSQAGRPTMAQKTRCASAPGSRTGSAPGSSGGGSSGGIRARAPAARRPRWRRRPRDPPGRRRAPRHPRSCGRERPPAPGSGCGPPPPGRAGRRRGLPGRSVRLPGTRRSHGGRNGHRGDVGEPAHDPPEALTPVERTMDEHNSGPARLGERRGDDLESSRCVHGRIRTLSGLLTTPDHRR